MKRQTVLRLAAMLTLLSLPSVVTLAADDLPMIVVFFEEGCASCIELEEFLVGMTTELPDSAIVRHEIHEPGVLQLLGSLETEYGVESPSVPVVFVGDIVVIGSGQEQEFELRDAISRCELYGCPSPLERVLTPQSIRADLLRIASLAALFLLLLLWQVS